MEDAESVARIKTRHDLAATIFITPLQERREVWLGVGIFVFGGLLLHAQMNLYIFVCVLVL